MLSSLCGSDKEVAFFIEMLITNSPCYKSLLYVDRVEQVVVPPMPYFRSLHPAKTIHACFFSSSGSNHFSFTHPALRRTRRSMDKSPIVQVSSVPIQENHVLETHIPETQFDEDSGLNFFDSELS